MPITPELLTRQLEAQAAAILAEGVALSTFQHKGIVGVEREEPVRRFLRNHLPGRLRNKCSAARKKREFVDSF